MWRKRFRDQVVQVVETDEELRGKRQKTYGLELDERALSIIISQEWPAFADSLSVPVTASASESTSIFQDDDFDDLAHVRTLIKGTPEYDAFLAQLEQEVMEEIREKLTSDKNTFSTSIACPVCQHAPPTCHQHGTLIFCTHCGLHLDTGTDGTTLAFLQDVMGRARGEHRSKCSAEPAIEARELPGTNQMSLVMTCGECGLLDIVL